MTSLDTGFTGEVDLRQTGDVDWALTAPLTYTALDGRVLEVPRGFGTDGASVPRIVSWLVPRSGRYLAPAVVHDRAYRVWVPAGQLTYRQADHYLAEAMRRRGVPALLRAAIWAAVRLAGLGRGRAGRRGWWRDAPAVLAITLPVLPIVVPPAVLVAVALALWALLEWLVVLALRVAGRRYRYVNPPTDLATSD